MGLRSTAFSAGRWTAFSAAMVAATQLCQTALLARLLEPGEFGLMAVIVAILAVTAIFSDMGVSRALIYFDNVSNESLSSLYWLNISMAICLAVILTMAAPAVANAYHNPDLVPVLRSSSLVFPLSAFGQQFKAIAERRLLFKDLAKIELAAAVCALLVAGSSALLGCGVYALVLGMLTAAGTSSLLAFLFLSGGSRPSLTFNLKSTQRYLRFGSYLVGDNLANTITRQADVFVGALKLSPAAVGLYSVPRDLSFRISMLINPVLTRVGFPLMSRLKEDQDKLRSIYLQTLRMTSSLNVPIYLTLCTYADGIVDVLYGPKWQGAVPYLRILAVWGLLRSFGNPVGSLLHAVGNVRTSFYWNVAILLITPAFLWIGVLVDGLTGLAWSMVVLQILVFLPVWRYLVRPACGATLLEYVCALAPPLVLSVMAIGTGLLLTSSLTNSVFRLVAGATLGGALYLWLCSHFNRSWFAAMLELANLPEWPWLIKTR